MVFIYNWVKEKGLVNFWYEQFLLVRNFRVISIQIEKNIVDIFYIDY